jgi:hypothetical protein
MATVGVPLLKDTETEFELPAVAMIVPQRAISEEQTIRVAEPLVDPVLKVRIEPLTLACITLEFELLAMI